MWMLAASQALAAVFVGADQTVLSSAGGRAPGVGRDLPPKLECSAQGASSL